jgi:hypothetical protein
VRRFIDMPQMMLPNPGEDIWAVSLARMLKSVAANGERRAKKRAAWRDALYFTW